MDWFVSAMMVWFYWATGNKWKYTWHLALVINVMWYIYAISLQEYGLIPSNIVIGIIGVRNLIKWRRDDER